MRIGCTGGSAPRYYRTHAYTLTEIYPRIYYIYIILYAREIKKSTVYSISPYLFTTNYYNYLLYIIYITLSFFIKRKKSFSPLTPLYLKKEKLIFYYYLLFIIINYLL